MSPRVIYSTSGRESSLKRYRKLLHKLNLSDQVEYVSFPTDANNPSAPISAEAFVKTLRAQDSLAGAISKDIKAFVVPLLDELHPSAQAVQSVNTIVRVDTKEDAHPSEICGEEGGDGQHSAQERTHTPTRTRLVGYNTDLLGFREALLSIVERIGHPLRSAIIYGYGGVTLVAVRVLCDLGVLPGNIFIAGRSLAKARVRADELGVRVWASPSLEAADHSSSPSPSAPHTTSPGPNPIPSRVSLFINATPVTDRPLCEAENFLAALMRGAGAASTLPRDENGEDRRLGGDLERETTVRVRLSGSESESTTTTTTTMVFRGPPEAVFDHEMPGQQLRDWVANFNQCLALPSGAGAGAETAAVGEVGSPICYSSGYDMYYPQMRQQWCLFLKGLAEGIDDAAVVGALDEIILEEKQSAMAAAAAAAAV
jgi:shikimate 5-dehydrogenase